VVVWKTYNSQGINHDVPSLLSQDGVLLEDGVKGEVCEGKLTSPPDSHGGGTKCVENMRREAGLDAVLSVKAPLDRLSLRHRCPVSLFRRILYVHHGT
jgi:hypothetical protein